jgi:hypothetical protein
MYTLYIEVRWNKAARPTQTGEFDVLMPERRRAAGDGCCIDMLRGRHK